MKSIKQLWERIINTGVTPELHERDVRYVQLTNGLAVLQGVWLSSLIIPILALYQPSSKYLLFNSIFFPLLWLLVLYLNQKKSYLLAKLFFFYSSMACITLNAIQVGKESDNHLFLLMVSIFAFYSWPPKQLKYIIMVCVSAFLAFMAVELCLSSHGPVLEAPVLFFQQARLISLTSLYVLVFMMTLYNYNTLHKAQDLQA